MLSRVEQPQYARTRGGAQVVYLVSGDGAGDPLVYLPGFVYSIESIFEDGPYARFVQGLARHGRVALLERQGVGASDPLDPTIDPWQQWCEDILAVVDDLGVTRAAVMGYGPSSHLALEAAIRHPDRIARVVAMHPFFQASDEEIASLRQEVLGNVARDESATRSALETNVPSRAFEQAYLDWSLRAGRMGSGPSAAQSFWEVVMQPATLAERLGTVECPVLFVLRREFARHEDALFRLEAATVGIRERLIHVLDGADMIPNAGDVDALVFDVAEFVYGPAVTAHGTRSLGVLLFTDIVESTSSVATAGDATWAQVLDQHDATIRRLLRRYGGELVNTTGDGALMCFDGPSRALECAVALREELRALELSIRIGLHLGEYERRGSDVAGVAVHLAARVMAEADPGDIVTTATVTLAMLGSGESFRPLGARSLKGLDGAFELFRLEGAG
jgi:class 3 adenylate cyclase